MSVKAFRTSSVAKGLHAADEGGMPRGPSSFNSRRASSASIPLGFKLRLLITSHCNMSRLGECLQVAPQSSQSKNKPVYELEASIDSSMGTQVTFNSS